MPLSPPAITPRGIEINAAAGAEFDPVAAGLALLHESYNGALSTLDPSGFPYGVVTNIATDYDGSPMFFMADLALHARNIMADDRVSLALAGFDKPDALTRPRLTLVGRAKRVPARDFQALAERYVTRFPKARLYLQLPDAALYRIEVSAMNIGGGPGRNASEVGFDAFRIDLTGADALIAAEAAELAALNEKPGLAAALAGGAAGRWNAISLDPAGLVLAAGERLLRVTFPRRAATPEAFHALVAELTGN